MGSSCLCLWASFCFHMVCSKILNIQGSVLYMFLILFKRKAPSACLHDAEEVWKSDYYENLLSCISGDVQEDTVMLAQHLSSSKTGAHWECLNWKFNECLFIWGAGLENEEDSKNISSSYPGLRKAVLVLGKLSLYSLGLVVLEESWFLSYWLITFP